MSIRAHFPPFTSVDKDIINKEYRTQIYLDLIKYHKEMLEYYKEKVQNGTTTEVKRHGD